MKENRNSSSLPILILGLVISSVIYITVLSIEKQTNGVAAKKDKRDVKNIYRVDNAESPDAADDYLDNLN